MTQTQWILENLKKRPLTHIDAQNGCGCARLAARINDLRSMGHQIETERFTTKNGANVARYRLTEKENKDKAVKSAA
jgi:hypothetical protein